VNDEAVFTVTNAPTLLDAVDAIVNTVTEALKTDAANNTPVVTGRLQAGWTITRPKAGERLLENPVSYGRYVEYGTRDMRAEAMLGRALSIIRAKYS
jgi:hypothetical protein